MKPSELAKLIDEVGERNLFALMSKHFSVITLALRHHEALVHALNCIEACPVSKPCSACLSQATRLLATIEREVRS